jgi:hypothetical protein
MSSKDDFKKSIKVNAKVNKHTPNFNDVESEEHTLWIQDEVNNSRQQQVHRLAYYLKQIHDLFHEQMSSIPVDFYGFGRVKSAYSMEQNINNGNNLLDALGITFVVSSVSTEIPPKDILRSALEKIDVTSPNSSMHYFKNELEKILTIADIVDDDIIKTGEEESFNVNLFHHNYTFKNAEVLFVHGINQFLSRTKKLSAADFPNKTEVFEILRQAKSATNYGASIDMYSQFVGYMKQSPFYEIIIQRFKPVMKPNRICCISFRCI